MELKTYLAILRRRWPLAIAPMLLALALSAGLALREPPRYRSMANLLITRSEDRRFDTEDALAYDLPAIVNGAPFGREVSEALARDGIELAPDEVRAALGASNQRRVVQVWAESTDPAQAETIALAAVGVIQTRGLALWGDPSATPGQTLVNVVVLDAPGPATQTNGAAALALMIALRGIAGLIAGILLIFGIHYWEGAAAPANH